MSDTKRSETKYGNRIPDGHWEQDDDEEDGESDTDSQQRTTVDSQIVDVIWRTDPRDLRFDVHVSHGDHRWSPVASFASRYHRIAESNQWDPMGEVDWVDLPVPVRRRVADVVAGVDSHEELDPETRIINPDEDGDES